MEIIEYFNEDFTLTEEPDFNFANWNIFDTSEDELAFNQAWVARIKKEAIGQGVDIFEKQADSDDATRYTRKQGYWTIENAGLMGNDIVIRLKHSNGTLKAYKFSGFYQPEIKGNTKYYLKPETAIIIKLVNEYIENKKGQKAEQRTSSFLGARAVSSLSDEEKKEALDWFSENISWLNIKYPTGVPSYTQEEGALDKNNPDVQKYAKKFAKLDYKFHTDFMVDKNRTEGYLDTAKRVHFEARDADKIQEKTLAYYNYWGLACDIYFKETLANAPEIILSLIAQAKKDSIDANNDAESFSQEDKKISSIFLCYAIKELVDDDWDKLSEIDSPIDDDNPFNQTFESLREAKEEICCICGEPIEGYGNNPEPYKHEGRCCDACNLKFVIPARLAQINSEEE